MLSSKSSTIGGGGKRGEGGKEGEGYLNRLF